MISVGHALTRTSPKAQKFLGSCIKCGAENLPAIAVGWECPNDAELMQEEAVIECVEGISALESECRTICEEKGYDPDYPAGETRKQWETFTELARVRMANRASDLIAGALGKTSEQSA